MIIFDYHGGPVIYYVTINTRAGEGLRVTRPRRGHIMPAAIAVPIKTRNTKLGGWVCQQNNSFWCKFCDLGSTCSRSNDVINAKFSPFWLNEEDITLAGLAPKLRQLASIRKKQRKRNEMGYLE